MVGPRFTNTPLPIQGRSLGITGRISGQQGDDHGPLIVDLDHLTFISAINITSPTSSPSKPSKGPGYFKRKRKRENDESQNVDSDVI